MGLDRGACIVWFDGGDWLRCYQMMVNGCGLGGARLAWQHKVQTRAWSCSDPSINRFDPGPYVTTQGKTRTHTSDTGQTVYLRQLYIVFGYGGLAV